MQFKPKYFCPVALMAFGLLGGLPAAEPTYAATTVTRQAPAASLTGHQGTAAVTLRDGVLKLGAGKLTKGTGWIGLC